MKQAGISRKQLRLQLVIPEEEEEEEEEERGELEGLLLARSR